MSLINMTPHPIHIIGADNQVIRTIEQSGSLIRLKANSIDAGFRVDDIAISRTEYSEPIGLPEYELGVFYIVSQLVKSALSDREDLLVPADVVRDKEGNIIGCRSLGI